MLNKTKVVVTIGPATMEKEQIKRLMVGGMDVARLNMSHANYNFCKDVIEKIQELNEELHLSIATMIDLMGPEVRTGKFANGEAYFRKGDKIRIYMDDITGDSTKFSVNYSGLIKDVSYNNIIKVKDGMMSFLVIDKKDDCIICEVLTDGTIENNQTVSVEGIKLNLPKMNNKDETDIIFAHKMNVDFLALSYVCTQEDVLAVSDILIGLKNDQGWYYF